MTEEIKDIIEAEKEYNASQIQVLEGLEAVRKRPGMYIGSTSSSGLHHLVYEIVDNAIDEALAGYCKHVVVTINEGNTITVTDDGRGIPVDIQAQTGKPALEVVYTVLHAGGKFGGGGYKVSGGLHGVGASVVNALSEWLEVEVSKDGKIYQMKFSRGHITQEMRIIGTTDKHGTKVTFKPDPEMFDTLEYDYETLHTRMREQAFLNAGLHITIRDERIESSSTSSTGPTSWTAATPGTVRTRSAAPPTPTSTPRCSTPSSIPPPPPAASPPRAGRRCGSTAPRASTPPTTPISTASIL